MSRHTRYELRRKCSKCDITAIEDKNLSFHRFPVPGRFTTLKACVWAEYCYPTGEWSTEKSLRGLYSQHKMLCSNHFDDTSFTSSSRLRLNSYAIPIGTRDLMAKLRQEYEVTSASERDTNISVEKPQVLVTTETSLPVHEPIKDHPIAPPPVHESKIICRPTYDRVQVLVTMETLPDEEPTIDNPTTPPPVHESKIICQPTNDTVKVNVLSKARYKNKRSTPATERLRIVKAAAAIIREDIKSSVVKTKAYPPQNKTLDGINEEIPKTLLQFLEEIILKNRKREVDHLKTKCTSISHTIMASIRQEEEDDDEE